MQGMDSMTKKDLIDFINEKFADCRDDDVIASFFFCSNGYKEPQQQCILFRHAVEHE